MRILLLVLLLTTMVHADTLPEEQHRNIDIYNQEVELPDEGNPWHILRATVGNSTQYTLKRITFALDLYKGEAFVHSQEVQIFVDVPAGQTKDFSKNFSLGYVIKDEKEFLVKLRIKSVKGTRKNAKENTRLPEFP